VTGHVTKNGQSPTTGSYPMLKLGADTAVASSRVSTFRWTSASIVASLVSARAASTDFVNSSGVSGGRWTLTRWPRSSVLSRTGAEIKLRGCVSV